MKFGELPITGKNQEFASHSHLIDVLFSIIGVIWLGLLIIVLIKLKKENSILDNKLSIFILLYTIIHVAINPLFFWYVG